MKVKFFYANGTSYLFKWLLPYPFSLLGPLSTLNFDGSTFTVAGTVLKDVHRTTGEIAGLRGETFRADGQPQNDPFPSMLDPNIFDAVRVSYPATFLGMGPSMAYGRDQIVNSIKRTCNPGDPIMTGGYSQGAAVVSAVELEFRTGGELEAWAPGYLGSVRFGNPRRQVNFRGEVGGTWSGAWDVAGSTTGGHGSFPSTGPWARLTGCDPTTTLEFAAPNDIITATGDSTAGLRWVEGNDVITDLTPENIIPYLSGAGLILAAFNTASAIGGAVNEFVDAVGSTVFIGGAGHTSYPFVPPVNNDGTPGSGPTSFQLALQWLEDKANEWATAPIILGATTAGWSNTLIPPAY